MGSPAALEIMLKKPKSQGLLEDNRGDSYLMLMWGEINKLNASERLMRYVVCRLGLESIEKVSHEIITFTNNDRLICILYREILENVRKRNNLCE